VTHKRAKPMHTQRVMGKLVDGFLKHLPVSYLLLLAGCRGHSLVAA